MSAAPIKTSYDRAILTMAAQGAVCSEIIAATGKTRNQIHNRAERLGVWMTVVRNTRDRRVAYRAALPGPRVKLTGYCGSRLAASAMSGRVDHAASELARALRAARSVADPSAIIPASFIAHVHEAGLTLDDIDAVFGVRPPQAVAAIRHHHEIRP